MTDEKDADRQARERNARERSAPSERREARAGDGTPQEKMDVETEQGYRGVAVDPTPNEAYTVEGVTSGMPTPETDADAAAEAREATGLHTSGIEQQAAAEAAAEDAAKSKPAPKG